MLHINLDTVEDLAEQVLLFNQLGHTCSKITVIIQRKVHFLYAKNLHAKLPGYGLVYSFFTVPCPCNDVTVRKRLKSIRSSSNMTILRLDKNDQLTSSQANFIAYGRGSRPE